MLKVKKPKAKKLPGTKNLSSDQWLTINLVKNFMDGVSKCVPPSSYSEMMDPYILLGRFQKKAMDIKSALEKYYPEDRY